MRTLTADLLISLDGFAGAEGAGPYFGYGGPELDAWVQRHLDQPQVVVMGRVTYEALARISAAADDERSSTLTALPKLVVSNSLTEPLSWENTRLLRGDLAEGMRALKQQSGPPLRTFGSISLVASLLELGLVDRLRLLVFPLVLGGSGREPAFDRFPASRLELAGTVVLDSRVVVLEYRPGAVPGER